MGALTKSLAASRALSTSVFSQALRHKAGGGLVDISPGPGLGQFGDSMQRSGDIERYSLNRGWVYAAINALASEAAGQDVQMGKMKGASPNDERTPGKTKGHIIRTMPSLVRNKAAREEVELTADSPLLDAISQPNAKQGQWQFVYSFVANLCLTGWSYVVGGETEDGKLEFYSLPTSWVTPIREEGSDYFEKFRVRSPSKVGEGEIFDRANVGFAHLPNPADPMGALAPAEARYLALRIDDHIQTSRSRFFENGIFPSVIVSVGKDPHPDVPGGIRPRLTAPQRRQVIGAIRKTMGGVANYGNPAIVDGMIDNIEKLSMGSNEMGWEKSETQIKAQILSVFCVHPFILGEAVNPGGYAQAAKIEERFCKRVNTYLNMLSGLMTSFAGPMVDESEKTLVWWEECKPHDPALYWGNMNKARDRNDISQNEIRAELGLPPDEDLNQGIISRQAVYPIVALLREVGLGMITSEQARVTLEGMGLPSGVATAIAGKGPSEVATEELKKAIKALAKNERMMEKLETKRQQG